MTKEQLEVMGIFGVESESELTANPEKNHAFAQAHHGMMSGSSIGLIIIEPASDAEIAEANKRLDAAIRALAGKGFDVDFCTYEEATAKRAKGLYEEWEVANRALKRLKNTEFGETAKSYLDEITAQRRRVFNPERPRAFSGNKHTEWGNGKELEAIAAYEVLTGLKLNKTGDKQEFIRLGYVESVDFDFSEWFGCTPDSATEVILDEDYEQNIRYTALIPREFKNPSSGVVFDKYRELKTPADLKKENALYYWQVIAQMACLNAPCAEWIAYDCDVISESERFVNIRFERDTTVEKVLIDSLFKAVQHVKSALE